MLRSQSGVFPSFLQMVLAAIAGVAVGVAIVAVSGNQRRLAYMDGGVVPAIANLPVDSVNSFNPFLGLSRFMPALDHRMNILVMGVDSNGKNTQRYVSTRSDTMMVVSVDPETKKVGIVSIPRDSRVAIAGGHGEDKINAAHAYGGPDLSVATVQNVFAVPIDRYIVVDAQGLRRLFEILGPVEVLVEKKMFYNDNTAGLHIALKPGLQQLDAAQAEEYVRFRHDATGDLGRIERQQWFIRQVYKKLQDPQIVLKLPALFNAANEYVVTNLTVDEMAKLANFAKDIKPSQIETAMVPGKATMINGGSYWLPDLASASIVFTRLTGMPISPLPENDRSYSQDTAYAATVAPPLTQAPVDITPPSDIPISVAVRYPKGSEVAAQNLESLASQLGYKIRGTIRADLADCQHSTIIENTARVNSEILKKLRTEMTCVADWPTSINIDPLAGADITLVVSPDTAIETAQAQDPLSQTNH